MYRRTRKSCQVGTNPTPTVSVIPTAYLQAIIVNRTYGTHKTYIIHLFLRTIPGPIYYRFPVNRKHSRNETDCTEEFVCTLNNFAEAGPINSRKRFRTYWYTNSSIRVLLRVSLTLSVYKYTTRYDVMPTLAAFGFLPHL